MLNGEVKRIIAGLRVGLRFMSGDDERISPSLREKRYRDYAAKSPLFAVELTAKQQRSLDSATNELRDGLFKAWVSKHGIGPSSDSPEDLSVTYLNKLDSPSPEDLLTQYIHLTMDEAPGGTDVATELLQPMALLENTLTQQDLLALFRSVRAALHRTREARQVGSVRGGENKRRR